MDLKLTDGDLVMSADGTPLTVSGIPQFCQQIALVLTVPRGSFVYNRNLGIPETVLSRELLDTVEMLLNENFVSSNVYIRINDISELQDGRKIDFTVITDNSQTDSEVILNG